MYLADKVILASAARTVTFNSDDQPNIEGKGLAVFLDITAVAGTAPTLDVKVQLKDPASGKYVDLTDAAFAQKTATGTDVLIIYPGVATLANKRISALITGMWRLVATIAGTAPSFTFSVGASVIP